MATAVLTAFAIPAQINTKWDHTYVASSDGYAWEPAERMNAQRLESSLLSSFTTEKNLTTDNNRFTVAR